MVLNAKANEFSITKPNRFQATKSHCSRRRRGASESVSGSSGAMPAELTAKAKVFVYRIAAMSTKPGQRGYIECVKPVQYPPIPPNTAKVPCDYPGQGSQ
jgi:hypothetical protein